jgi:sterol desaturase/sphingolipid hydroxylase (fatty acid hydroxylase superfamily)
MFGSQKVVVDSVLTTSVKQLLLLPLLFIVYDFFYSIFHRVLHERGIYKHIHKHHHQQHAPSRGQIDAINVHPFEFLTGEYNHLMALIIVGHFFPIHPVTAFLFILTGGVLASLNHTRYHIKVGPIFSVAYHDLHHWQPKTNFGQYTMFWDYIFGWFKPYEAPKVKKQHQKEN